MPKTAISSHGPFTYGRCSGCYSPPPAKADWAAVKGLAVDTAVSVEQTDHARVQRRLQSASDDSLVW